jgi:hypothetical protein
MSYKSEKYASGRQKRYSPVSNYELDIVARVELLCADIFDAARFNV